MTSERRGPGSTPERPRILVLRSCRPQQFAAAVQSVRQRHGDAHVTALSHAGHTETLRAAGVDHVIELPGSRFGLRRLGPITLRRLRAVHYDDVVVPQMVDWPAHHANLYRVVYALRWRALTIIPGDRPAIVFEGHGAFRPFLLQSMGGLSPLTDAIAFMILLAAAWLRRRRPGPVPGGRRQRLLYVISTLGVGGAQVQLAGLLDRLPADTYEPELLVLGDQAEDFSRQWLARTDVPIHYLRQWPRLTLSALEIRDLCAARQYDVVHTWLFMANLLGAAGARLAGVPVVIASVRNLSVWKRRRYYGKWWYRPADILASRAADLVTVNAAALAPDHGRWALMPSSRIAVIHNGLDPASFLTPRDEARAALLRELGVPASAALIGTVGRLAIEKDHATFLRLIAAVRRTRPEAHAVLIGDGVERVRLEALAAELGIAAHVNFLGVRPDARRLMAGLDLFVLTSFTEGFPNVLLEATLLGVPCVATDVAGNPDVLHFTESLFAVGDLDAGRTRILAALADRALTTARATAARARARELFSADRTAASWLALYRRMTAAAPNDIAGASIAHPGNRTRRAAVQ